VEQERRLAGVAAAGTYADLTSLVDGLPGPFPMARDDLLVTAADRQTVLDRLSASRADGLLTADEHAELQDSVRGAERYRNFDQVAVHPVEPASPAEQPAESKSPGRAGRRGLLAVVVAAMVATGVFIVVRHAGGAPPDQGLADPRVLWSAPYDRPSEVRGVGSWITSDTVIRADTDKVVAYAVSDGHVSWTFPLPAGNTVCTMSRTVEGNIGLIGYAALGLGEDCSTPVALDTGTGRSMWQRQRPASETISDAGSDEVALAKDVAVIKEPTGFVAVDLQGKTPRWRLAAAKTCAPNFVAAAGDTAAMVTVCVNQTAHLVVVAAARASNGGARSFAPAPKGKANSATARRNSSCSLSTLW